MTALRTAVITGASRGIGLETGLHFLNKGWRVIGCARSAPSPQDQSRIDEMLQNNKAARHHHLVTDIANQHNQQGFITQVAELLGDDALHVLINNAAQSPKSDYKERLGCLNGDMDKWRDVFELNLFAPLSLARGFAPYLARASQAAKNQSDASIINITSIAGHRLHPFAGSAYATSKAALSALTREMAVEFAQIGVRVNAIAPGEIKTNMLSSEYEPLSSRIPLQRLGSAAEVARAIYQLCQSDFSYVTGDEIFLTGGQHLY